MSNDPFIIAGTTMSSRLFVGSARYPSQQVMLDAMAASGPCMVTMSIRRISLKGYAESLVDLLGDKYRILPNTAGCVTSRDDAPMLGPSGIDGLTIATGHHRNGILLTPVSAAVVADGILTGGMPEIALPFAPGRFARPAAEAAQ